MKLSKKPIRIIRKVIRPMNRLQIMFSMNRVVKMFRMKLNNMIKVMPIIRLRVTNKIMNKVMLTGNMRIMNSILSNIVILTLSIKENMRTMEQRIIKVIKILIIPSITRIILQNIKSHRMLNHKILHHRALNPKTLNHKQMYQIVKEVIRLTKK